MSCTQAGKEQPKAYRSIKVEDLDLAAMKQSMSRRAFRRSVSDAALGLIPTNA